MEMRHGFAAIRPVVDHQSVTALKIQLLRHRSRLEQEMTDQLMILGRGFAEAGDRLLRHDEDMRRRLGVDVAKGTDLVILKHDLGGNLAGDDLLENGFAHAASVAGAAAFVKRNSRH